MDAAATPAERPNTEEAPSGEALEPWKQQLDSLRRQKLEEKKKFTDTKGQLRLNLSKAVETLVSANLAGDSSSKEIDLDVEAGNLYSDDVKVSEFCSAVVETLATGEALNIPAAQMPSVNIPEAARAALAQRWAEDIAQIEAGLPVRAGEPAPGTQAEKPPVTLPDTAPELYRDRPRSLATGRLETIVEFLERVWKDPWIDAGVLSRPDFRRLDHAGEMALRNWQNNAKNALPQHLHLPTKTEVVSRQLDERSPEAVREAQRLASASQRRRKQDLSR